MTDAIGSARRRLSGLRGWIAIAGFALLWTALGIDIILWLLRLSGGYSSKANLLSHFWPYLSFGGALAGLLATPALLYPLAHSLLYAALVLSPPQALLPS